jgi:hypothetical protein
VKVMWFLLESINMNVASLKSWSDSRLS